MKYIQMLIATLLVCYLPLQADIVKTIQIEDVVREADENTLVFFNIAEVLMDTETSLGTQAWRKYIRARLTPQLHDELTLYVFGAIPPKTPEPATANAIRCLQEKKIPVFAFTSRGRHEWYSTQIPGVDLLTEKLLLLLKIDFSRSQLPAKFAKDEMLFREYFHNGIVYATNAYEKGEILLQFLDAANLHPSKIIFVDDKADSLHTVEQALKERGIPFKGFAYSRTSQEHANFDPMIAHIQLDWLISHGQVLSDEEAGKKKALLDPLVDHEKYFSQIMEKWNKID